jgi:hypothetical protein
MEQIIEKLRSDIAVLKTIPCPKWVLNDIQQAADKFQLIQNEINYYKTFGHSVFENFEKKINQ